MGEQESGENQIKPPPRKQRIKEIDDFYTDRFPSVKKMAEEIEQLYNDSFAENSENYTYKERFSEFKSLVEETEGIKSKVIAYKTEIESELETIESHKQELLQKLDEQLEAYKKQIEVGTDSSPGLNSILENAEARSKVIQKINQDFVGYKLNKEKLISKEEADLLPETCFIIYDEVDGSKTYYQTYVAGFRQIINNAITESGKLKTSTEKILNESYAKFNLDSDELLADKEKKLSNILEKIHGTLPGATTITLASEFNNAKERHEKNEFFFQCVFAISLLGMFLIPFIAYGMGILSFPDVLKLGDVATNFQYLITQLLRLLPFEIPLIWLAVAANRKMHKESRLKEEYLHKAVIAKTYIGMQEEAKKVDENNQIDISLSDFLLTYFIEIAAQNPSPTLEKEPRVDSPMGLIDWEAFRKKETRGKD